MTAPTPIWVPRAPEKSRMYRFLERVVSLGYGVSDYDTLWRFSIDEPARFWSLVWEEIPVRASAAPTQIMGEPKMPGTEWFSGARLNFAANLLSRAPEASIALVARDEGGRREVLTQRDLSAAVERLSSWLSSRGVVAGDRVVAFLPNREEAVIGMLAATRLGAIWSSCSPDFGLQGVIDRFGQIAPKVLLACDGYRYGGKTFDTRERVSQIIASLPSLQAVVSVPVLGLGLGPGAVDFAGAASSAAAPAAETPFDHPVYIMYSSGTTGVPKCIVHGVGGTLLQHGKELLLHSDISPGDALFWYTTTGWMMWNWLVSGLMTGATVVLWDGSPAHGPSGADIGALWKMAAEEGITHFGTSPKFLASCASAGYRPKDGLALPKLRAVMSTGSPLAPDQFHYVADAVGPVQIASICGGTDILGCFMLGSPIDPVYAGEIQKRGLGMAVEAWSDAGEPLVGEKAELVCTRPFPSMPVSFWGDPSGEKYQGAYFRRWPSVWHHGDFIELTERGGVIVYGRSDATLNPGGVRIGTAEIYSVVETLPQILDSIVIAQEMPAENDVRVVLFVVLRPGVALDEPLRSEIRTQIRTRCTPRHVPAKIVAVADIPRTISGKKVEIAVQRVVHGLPVPNRDALANPAALDLFRDLPELSDQPKRG